MNFFRSVPLAGAFFAAAMIPAIAADLQLPTKKAPPAPSVPFSWTGFYVGGNVGAAWNTGRFDDSADPNRVFQDVPIFDANNSGPIGGLQAGYNYQIGQFVAGVEVGASAAGIDGKTYPTLSNGSAFLQTKQDWLANAGIRLGYAFDRILVYASGGAAFTGYNISTQDTFSGFTFPQAYGTNSRSGWTLGLGADYALTNNWIVGFDYKYYDFGGQTFVSGFRTGAAGGPGFDTFRLGETENVLTARVSYKF